MSGKEITLVFINHFLGEIYCFKTKEGASVEIPLEGAWVRLEAAVNNYTKRGYVLTDEIADGVDPASYGFIITEKD